MAIQKPCNSVSNRVSWKGEERGSCSTRRRRDCNIDRVASLEGRLCGSRASPLLPITS